MNPQDLKGFHWLNEPVEFRIEENELHVTTGSKSDFFNNPEDHSITCTAPLLYRLVKGDFVATALVKPDFSSMWNAASLMVHMDSLNWIKLAFENSDATGKSIVSVVTRDVSDDANGVILDAYDSIWLRIIRKKNLYALHWSMNGEEYKMARLSAMPYAEEVKVGLEAQCPVGESAKHTILYFSLEQITVQDLRQGE